MACEQCRSQLDAYLDGELTGEQMSAVDAHLRTSPACAADALARVQLKRTIKTAGSRFTPSLKFREKIEKKIGARRSRKWSFGWAVAGALAVLLLLGSVMSYLETRNLRQQHVY